MYYTKEELALQGSLEKFRVMQQGNGKAGSKNMYTFSLMICILYLYYYKEEHHWHKKTDERVAFIAHTSTTKWDSENHSSILGTQKKKSSRRERWRESREMRQEKCLYSFVGH